MNLGKKTRYRYGRIIVVLIIIIVISFLGGYFVSQSHPIIIANNGSGTISEIYEILEDKWVNPNEEIDFDQAAAAGLVAGLNDIYTSYMTPEETDSFNSTMDGSLTGIGVRFVASSKGALISEIIDNSPAQESGLKAGDIIIACNDTSLAGLTSTEIRDIITGSSGTVASLQVKYLNQVRQVEITRQYIETASIASIREINGVAVGYLEITTFGSQTAMEVKSGLEMFKSAEIETIVIDLRSNGGGLLSACNDILDMFIGQGEVTYSISTNDNPSKEYTSAGNVVDVFKKGYILTDENTASAAEIMTGALIYDLGYQTVGTTTFGKGIAQVSIPLTDGSTLKYTYAKWYMPNGENIHKTGIEPDYSVASYDALSFVNLNIEAAIEVDTVDVDNVKPVQEALEFLGYSCRTDGYLNQETIRQLNKFEKENGLDQSNSLTVETYEAVISKVLNNISLEENDQVYNELQKLIK